MLFIVIVIMDILSSAEIDICVPSFPEIQSVFGISSFALVSLSSEKLFRLFGVKKCFWWGIAIGLTVSATIVASLMLCRKLLKIDNVFEET